MELKIKYHVDHAVRIGELVQGDWVDLRSAEKVYMYKGDFMYISLGISVEIPKGYEMHIVPRSSTYKKFGVIQANHMGIIDNSYCGDNDIICFPAIAMRDTVIGFGDRICQFRLMKNQEPLEFVEVDTLGNPDRGGLGSTGTN